MVTHLRRSGAPCGSAVGQRRGPAFVNQLPQSRIQWPDTSIFRELRLGPGSIVIVGDSTVNVIEAEREIPLCASFAVRKCC